MNKVEDSRVNIFYKENMIFFCKFTREHKVIGFPKLKLYVESPRIMINKCVLTNCSAGGKMYQLFWRKIYKMW